MFDVRDNLQYIFKLEPLKFYPKNKRMVSFTETNKLVKYRVLFSHIYTYLTFFIKVLQIFQY